MTTKRLDESIYFAAQTATPEATRSPKRNEPCPCGSGKKYKQCCLRKVVTKGTQDPLLLRPPSSSAQLLALAIQKHQARQLPEALKLYARILSNEPSHQDALHLAGIAAHESGDSLWAVSLLERWLETDPKFVAHYLNCGQVLQANGLLDRALFCYENVAAMDPGLETGHLKAGIVLLAVGRLAEAANSFSNALCLSSQSFEATRGLGTALFRMGQLDQAIECLRKAISLKPGDSSTINDCGTALYDAERFDEAITCFRQALAIDPESAAVLSNLGGALRRKGILEEAIQCSKRAIELEPDLARAHVNLGSAYCDQGQYSEAVIAYRKAIEMDPRYARAYSNLANALVQQDNVIEALENYAKAIEYAPAKHDSFSNLLFLHSTYQISSPQQECELARSWEKVHLSEEERMAARIRARASSGVFSAAPQNGRILRLGIVCAELGPHPVSAFLRPFLDELDHRRIELVLFPTVLREHAIVEHFRSLAVATIPLTGMPDARAAARIREERIDILIETTGHLANCRLGIFAHRAAPVQCSYIGYWSTTGLTEMDWYITDDDYAHGCEAHFTERLWKLPHRAHCYYGDESLPDSGWTPDMDGTIWLGSFNRYNKIRRETLALWAKVLTSLPQAKLLLEDRTKYETESQERILAVLRDNGISAERVVFLPSVMTSGFAAHMRLYDRIDIALDTIPANSGTTAFDALWMGVPLAALEGTRVVSRMAASILRGLGRPEWVASNQEEYVSIVCALAKDIEGRTKLRRSLRSEMRKSELCDGRGLARSLEDAFEAMHDLWRTAT